jgi:sugar O-acyltransferase (sialic acid O-acetyltransferase NeuD family)
MANEGPVAVIGAGGHAKVVIGALVAAGRAVAGVWDDDPAKLGGTLLGVPVLGPTADAVRAGFRPAVLAVGDNRARQQLAAALDLDWVTVVHPRAWVHPSVRLGEGSVVFAAAIVQPDTVVGCHAIVNTGATIDHDCEIGDFAHVAPGVNLSGGVRVGNGTLLGVGSCAVPGARIGAWAVVGAGAVVVDEVPDGATVVGAPARPAGGSR